MYRYAKAAADDQASDPVFKACKPVKDFSQSSSSAKMRIVLFLNTAAQT
jgi:hypothetical protein